ncbi:energy-coupling factor ABC transporter ATP-binding protein, partial [Lactobacillus delbrueckii subsp. bulgaricus]|nr:energy-coupling factor ABC transporter ATP-binding protein [Lactobacillus delbrueckii subsp. bulgaricus]
AKLEAAGLKLPGQPLTMPELADAIKQSLKGGEHE